MSWTEREIATGKEVDVDVAKARLLDEVKKTSLPIVQKEADAGARPIAQVQFQPVKATNTFEAEFGVKGEDLLFHFWPYGYHDVERYNDGLDSAMCKSLPKFKSDFEKLLSESMYAVFGKNRCELSFDGDVGAWFVKANGWGQSQFHRNLCIEAVTILHRAMGGTDS